MNMLFKQLFKAILGVWIGMMVSSVWAIEPDEIVQQMDKMLHSESYELYYRLTFELPTGRIYTQTIYSAKQGDDKALAVVVAPDDLKGRAVLRLGDEVWMHIPGELALRQSNLMVSMLGGVFTNADLLLGSFHASYQATLLGEDTKSWRLALHPRSKSSPYAKMVLTIDKKSKMPVELSQFDFRDKIMKTLHYRDIQSVDNGHLYPMMIETVSELNQGYKSSWQVGAIVSRTFPKEAFTREFLPHAGRLMKE